MPNVYIPKEYERKRTLTAVPTKEYEEFLAHRREVRDALAKIARSRAEYRAGKTQVVQSLRELR